MTSNVIVLNRLQLCPFNKKYYSICSCPAPPSTSSLCSPTHSASLHSYSSSTFLQLLPLWAASPSLLKGRTETTALSAAHNPCHLGHMQKNAHFLCCSSALEKGRKAFKCFIIIQSFAALACLLCSAASAAATPFQTPNLKRFCKSNQYSDELLSKYFWVIYEKQNFIKSVELKTAQIK